MPKPLENQVAIVTGAAQGIGLAVCQELAYLGANVLLNDVEARMAEEAAARVRKEKGVCEAAPGDASDVKFVRSLVSEAVTRFGRLDIVVANAGITLFGDFLSYSPEDFFAVMKLNLGGSFFLAQAAAIQMKQQGEGGSILFMSSVTGHQAHKNLSAYGMSKAALEMLARGLVVELSEFRINVNAIAPGATLTHRTETDPDYEKTWSSITPMGRPATAKDIAHAAAFFVSPASRHITGQSLVIDGGWSAVSPSPY